MNFDFGANGLFSGVNSLLVSGSVFFYHPRQAMKFHVASMTGSEATDVLRPIAGKFLVDFVMGIVVDVILLLCSSIWRYKIESIILWR